MSVVSDDLVARARELAELAAAYPALAERAERLADRVAAERFHVAVVGAFKRGKSTLINALLEQAVLPTGVLPLTAIATEVSYGPPGATIVGLDATRFDVPLAGLDQYVTEAGNPANRRGVARAEVRIGSALLASGLVLVDTPGLGSIHGHDPDTLRAVEQSDAAIVVLAADMALADDEQQLLGELTRRRARVFIVVNKADHVSASDLDSVREYLASAFGTRFPVWCVSARAAIEGHPDEAGEFDAFRASIEKFATEELGVARISAARSELGDIAHQVAERCWLEAAAASLDADTLAAAAERFRSLATAERQTFDGEQLLLAQRSRELLDDLTTRLNKRAATAARSHDDELTAASEGPVADIENRLDEQVDSIVRHELAEWHSTETETVDAAWRKLADAARTRTAARIAAVRTAASDLFAVELAPAELTSVTDEPDPFWFLLTPPVSMSYPYIHIGRALQPSSRRRRRSIERARRRLSSELDKHAGRLRHGISERLDHARTRFTTTMTAALDDTITSIGEAIAAAEHARTADDRAAASAMQRGERAIALVGTEE